MNLQEITSLITKAASAIEANEKFALPVLAARARREAAARPTDVPLINASQVLTKMASDKTFISRSELSEIVERLGASHSKLSQIFTEELGKRAEPKPHTFVRDANEGVSVDRDYKRFADPILSNALAGAFDKNPTERIYSNDDAQRAQRAAYAQLIGIGCRPKEISTFAGRKDIIICQATHETPVGKANVLIPVELIEGKAALPQFFFSQSGFQDFEKEAYENHVLSVAGKSFRVDGAKLLDVLEQVKKGESTIVNEVELAAIKIASEQGTPSIDPNGVYYTEVFDKKEDVALPKMPETPEAKFAETLGKPDGVARFIHGDKVVEAGRSAVIRKLAELGYKNVQVKVADVEREKIFYAVAIGTGTGLKVPVDIVEGRINSPQIIFADGMVAAFTKEAISEAIKSGTGGNKRALAAASPCYDMKPTELLDVVKQSVSEGNYIRAEEAINTLGEIDPQAQKVAIAVMMNNIYLPGQSPDEEIAAQRSVAKQQVRDTVPVQFMTNKIFFPEGA
jgi:hypothetical protein